MTANLAYSIQGILTQVEFHERNISKADAYNEIYPEKQANCESDLFDYGGNFTRLNSSNGSNYCLYDF